MIYFDDELPPLIKPPRTRRQRWIRRGIIVCGVVLFLFWLSLYVLSAIGGDSPALRTGVENYLRSISGYDVQIRQFNKLVFYPELAIDIGDVEFSKMPRSPAPGLHGPVMMTAASIKISMGFWDMFFHRGRLRTLAIDDLNLGNVLGLTRPVIIRHIILEKTTNGSSARLHVNGNFGAEPFEAMQMVGWLPVGDGLSNGVFFRPSSAGLNFSSPLLNFKGVLRLTSGAAEINLAEIDVPHAVLAGQIKWLADRQLKIKLTHGDSVLYVVNRPGSQETFDAALVKAPDLPAFRALAAALQMIKPALLNNLPKQLQANVTPLNARP